jgi:hypothetical protein
MSFSVHALKKRSERSEVPAALLYDALWLSDLPTAAENLRKQRTSILPQMSVRK